MQDASVFVCDVESVCIMVPCISIIPEMFDMYCLTSNMIKALWSKVATYGVVFKLLIKEGGWIWRVAGQNYHEAWFLIGLGMPLHFCMVFDSRFLYWSTYLLIISFFKKPDRFASNVVKSRSIRIECRVLGTKLAPICCKSQFYPWWWSEQRIRIPAVRNRDKPDCRLFHSLRADP